MDANRTAVAVVEEVTPGTTPAAPAFEALRVTAINMTATPQTAISNELQPDRQIRDVIRVGDEIGGDLPFELSFDSMHTLIQGGLFSSWLYKPIRENATADDVITDVSATTYTVAATAGVKKNSGVFAQYMLVRAGGFTNSANNKLFVAAALTGATAVVTAGNTVEAAPPTGARLKAIGFSASGAADITATATGLASVTIDFTTFGLNVGDWVKVGGTAAGNQFDTAANNGWCRISAIAANLLTFDIRPTGWGVDAAAAKTIYVFMGDTLRNGVTKRHYSVETKFEDLDVVEYNYFRGCVVNNLNFAVQSKDIMKGSVGFVGMTHENATARFAAATDVAAGTKDVMNASSNVGTLYEGGAAIPGKNYVLGVTLGVNNNLRRQNGLGSITALGIGIGRCIVEGTLDAYYGSNAIYAKVRSGAATSLTFRVEDPTTSAASYVFDLPRIKFVDGSPENPGIDSDRTIKTKFQALRHSTLGYTMQVQRFEEYQ